MENKIKHLQDPLVKCQFYIRTSLYELARSAAPNRGDLSELMREGIELGIEARLRRTKNLQQAIQSSEEIRAS